MSGRATPNSPTLFQQSIQLQLLESSEREGIVQEHTDEKKLLNEQRRCLTAQLYFPESSPFRFVTEEVWPVPCLIGLPSHGLKNRVGSAGSGRSFATPSPQRLSVMSNQGPPGQRPTMGVEIKMLDDATGGSNNVMVVHAVSPGGPAAMSGIQPEDILTSFNGIALDSKPLFGQLLKEVGVGAHVNVAIVRHGVAQQVNVTIAGATGERTKRTVKSSTKVDFVHSSRRRTPSIRGSVSVDHRPSHSQSPAFAPSTSADSIVGELPRNPSYRNHFRRSSSPSTYAHSHVLDCCFVFFLDILRENQWKERDMVVEWEKDGWNQLMLLHEEKMQVLRQLEAERDAHKRDLESAKVTLTTLNKQNRDILEASEMLGRNLLERQQLEAMTILLGELGKQLTSLWQRVTSLEKERAELRKFVSADERFKVLSGYMKQQERRGRWALQQIQEAEWRELLMFSKYRGLVSEWRLVCSWTDRKFYNLFEWFRESILQNEEYCRIDLQSSMSHTMNVLHVLSNEIITLLAICYHEGGRPSYIHKCPFNSLITFDCPLHDHNGPTLKPVRNNTADPHFSDVNIVCHRCGSSQYKPPYMIASNSNHFMSMASNSMGSMDVLNSYRLGGSRGSSNFGEMNCSKSLAIVSSGSSVCTPTTSTIGPTAVGWLKKPHPPPFSPPQAASGSNSNVNSRSSSSPHTPFGRKQSSIHDDETPKKIVFGMIDEASSIDRYTDMIANDHFIVATPPRGINNNGNNGGNNNSASKLPSNVFRTPQSISRFPLLSA